MIIITRGAERIDQLFCRTKNCTTVRAPATLLSDAQSGLSRLGGRRHEWASRRGSALARVKTFRGGGVHRSRSLCTGRGRGALVSAGVHRGVLTTSPSLPVTAPRRRHGRRRGASRRRSQRRHRRAGCLTAATTGIPVISCCSADRDDEGVRLRGDQRLA